MSSTTRAAVVVANDAFIDYFIPFLESFREYNPDLRLIVIPFDDSVRLVKLLAPIYNFEMYDGSFEDIDRLADMLFGEDERLRRRMRKLAAFDMDLEEFLYIDTDILVGMDLTPFFGHTLNGSVDLVCVSSGGDWVYRQGAELHLDVASSARFSTAMYVSSCRAGSVTDIANFMAPRREAFLSVRLDTLFDQPLLNFYCDMAGKSARYANEFAVDFVFCDAHFHEDVTLKDGKAMLGSQPITLCHWSGPQKFSRNLRLAGLLSPYVLRARERLTGIPEFREWFPFPGRGSVWARLAREAKRFSAKLRHVAGTAGNRRIVRPGVTAWPSEAQLTEMQAEIIGSLIAYRSFSANLLIFGAGHDTAYWAGLNSAGRTMVIEDDVHWIKKVRRHLKSVDVIHHSYPTTVAGSATLDETRLAACSEPAGLAGTRWDIILIDGPAGYDADKPGRALPVYWAYKYSSPATHIFVDDYDRPLERNYCNHFFGNDRERAILPSHDGGEMFWRIGSGVPEKA